MEAKITVSAKLGNYEIDCTVLIGSDESIKEQIYEELKEQYPEIKNDENVGVDEIIWEVIDWEELSDYPNLQDNDLLEEIADYNGCNDLDILNSAVECDIKISNVDDSYSGSCHTNAEFAEDMAEETCTIPKEWPFYYIDWERAANDLMMDYSEANGHYFRNF